jgi:hypothetical protein
MNFAKIGKPRLSKAKLTFVILLPHFHFRAFHLVFVNKFAAKTHTGLDGEIRTGFVSSWGKLSKNIA